MTIIGQMVVVHVLLVKLQRTKPFSERESRNMKALVEGLGDITAHVDCHNIVLTSK